MRRRSTFWSRARASSRSSGPSKPSRLTISSPSPGAITSGPCDANVSALKPSAGGGAAGSLMQSRFNPVGPPAATGFPAALSPFGEQFGEPSPGLPEGARRAMAGEVFAPVLEAAQGLPRHGPGVLGDVGHLVRPAVAMKGYVAARGERA